MRMTAFTIAMLVLCGVATPCEQQFVSAGCQRQQTDVRIQISGGGGNGSDNQLGEISRFGRRGKLRTFQTGDPRITANRRIRAVRK